MKRSGAVADSLKNVHAYGSKCELVVRGLCTVSWNSHSLSSFAHRAVAKQARVLKDFCIETYNTLFNQLYKFDLS